jgi:hypothetical protein
MCDPTGFPSEGSVESKFNATQCNVNRKGFARLYFVVSLASRSDWPPTSPSELEHVPAVTQNAYLINELTVTIRSSIIGNFDRRVLKPVSMIEGKIYEVIFITGR